MKLPLFLPAVGSAGNEGPAMHVDARWRPIIEPITTLKDAIDRVVFRDNAGRLDLDQADIDCLVKHGLDAVAMQSADRWNATRMAGHGDQLLTMLLGNIILAKPPANQDYSPFHAAVPPWTTLGWVRKTPYLRPVPLNNEEIEAKLAFMRSDYERPINRCYGGIPLILAAEGKNRCVFHRALDIPQHVSVEFGRYPEPECMELQELHGFAQLLLLHVRTDLCGTVTCFLPFPKLSLPLLTAYGVPLARKHLHQLKLPFLTTMGGDGQFIKVHERYSWRTCFSAKRLWNALIWKSHHEL